MADRNWIITGKLYEQKKKNKTHTNNVDKGETSKYVDHLVQRMTENRSRDWLDLINKYRSVIAYVCHTRI